MLTYVNATDLSAWAGRCEAQALLPQVLRRLIHATVGRIRYLSFRSGDGVQLSGWDGVVDVDEGNSFVPDGRSVWELGTTSSVTRKADEDYDKRKSDPLGADPAETTFVFVTPRRWRDKAKWVNARKIEGFWHDVRAYDGDDLETWLEIAPSVHVWLSIHLGKHPSGARDIESFWANWSGATRPTLSRGLLLAGRQEQAQRVAAWLQKEPSLLAVRADTREEAVAFFAATFDEMPADERDAYLSRSLVVEDAEAWRRLVMSAHPLLLIPLFPHREGIATAVQAGHHLLVPLSNGEQYGSDLTTLPRLPFQQAKVVLAGMGVPENRANELAVLARRSLGALRRTLAVVPEVQRPEWARAGEGRALLPALLVGNWDTQNAGDQKAMANLASVPHEEFEGALARWENEPDPPVRRVGSTWVVSSKEDAWSLLAPLLTDSDLNRFETIAVEVLTEIDPKFDLPIDRQWMAGAVGKSRQHSDLLREGIADTLALMAARSETIRPAGAVSAQDRASRTVRRLLSKAKDDWRLWASLSPVLPSLAEAAPNEFLAAADADLTGDEPLLLRLFAEGKDILFCSSPHTGLLWALESLAWSPDYLGYAARLLARLARLDSGGKIRNRPDNSLRTIFLCWYPATTASLEQRLRVLDTLRAREPQVAWRLLCRLLPERPDHTSLTCTPRWRDWVPDPICAAAPPEPLAGIREIVNRLLADVGSDGQRWRDLIERIDDLPGELFDAVIEKLLSVEAANFGSPDRVLIRDSLRRIIASHRWHAGAEEALPGDQIAWLSAAYERFEPEDLISRYGWLFGANPALVEASRADWKSEQAMLEARRLEVVAELHAAGGVRSLVEMAARVERPDQLGVTLGRSDLLAGDEDSFLSEGLASSDRTHRHLTLGFAAARVRARGWAWAEERLSAPAARVWRAEQSADFFTCMPFEGHTWDYLETADPEIKRLYWSIVNPCYPPDTDCERAATKLVEYDRPHAAVNVIAYGTAVTGATVSPSVVAHALERAAQMVPQADIDRRWFEHHAEDLLNALEASAAVDEERLAMLEWAYLPLRSYRRSPAPLLHRELARNPEFFAKVVRWVYQGEDEEQREVSEGEVTRAHLGHELLQTWREIPGRGADGAVETDALSVWVNRARESLHASGRGAIGDQTIGQILACAPEGEDGAWPDTAVRGLIEDTNSSHLELGFEIAVYNRRGITTKCPTEGGDQERHLVEIYLRHARLITDRWPRTAAVLRRIADRYRSEAGQSDAEAELRQDLET